MKKSKTAADLLAADPLFMGMHAAWPLAGQRPYPQVCELAILDKNGAILFDTIIRPSPITGATLQTRLIPAEHVMTAPTIDTLWGNLTAIVNRRDVVMFQQLLRQGFLEASAAPYDLPDLPCRFYDIRPLYISEPRLAPELYGGNPSLTDMALGCELEHMTLAISQNVDQPWRIHHAVNEAETCRRVLMHLFACAQATADEGQQKKS